VPGGECETSFVNLAADLRKPQRAAGFTPAVLQPAEPLPPARCRQSARRANKVCLALAVAGRRGRGVNSRTCRKRGGLRTGWYRRPGQTAGVNPGLMKTSCHFRACCCAGSVAWYSRYSRCRTLAAFFNAMSQRRKDRKEIPPAILASLRHGAFALIKHAIHNPKKTPRSRGETGAWQKRQCLRRQGFSTPRRSAATGSSVCPPSKPG